MSDDKSESLGTQKRPLGRFGVLRGPDSVLAGYSFILDIPLIRLAQPLL
jgi:hypothetical protein